VTTLTWDRTGDRTFHTGVDRGVLYMTDGRVVPWNGLTNVEQGSPRENKSFYLDGVKYLEVLTQGDFSGRLKAITYPSEFDEVNGIAYSAEGLSYYDQPSKTFNLSYRTKIGNDVEGQNYGYKIHLLYNLVANPETLSFDTIGNPLKPVDFSWILAGTPPAIRRGYRPTVHVSIDSRDTDPSILEAIEDILYGSAVTNPRLPSIDELTDLFKALGTLTIVDNGDGTWTAIDVGNDYITMLDSTTFEIHDADAEFIDATTYTISTTNPE
jgi:hypothetical protein